MQRALFYLLYPLLIVYAPIFSRSRVLIRAGNEFLAVKANFGNSLWHLPGGGVKKGETRQQAAIREIKEELDIELKTTDLRSLKPNGFYRNQGLWYRGEVFLVDFPAKKPVFKKNHEIEEVAWLPTDPSMPGLGKIVVVALKRLRRL